MPCFGPEKSCGLHCFSGFCLASTITWNTDIWRIKDKKHCANYYHSVQSRAKNCNANVCWNARRVKSMPSTERAWLDFQEYIPGHLGQHSSLTHWTADLAFFRISTSGAGTSSADIGTNNADISRSAADIGKNTADIGKNTSNKSTKNLSRSLIPHSPGAAGRVNTLLCLVASLSTSGWDRTSCQLFSFPCVQCLFPIIQHSLSYSLSQVLLSGKNAWPR